MFMKLNLALMAFSATRKKEKKIKQYSGTA